MKCKALLINFLIMCPLELFCLNLMSPVCKTVLRTQTWHQSLKCFNFINNTCCNIIIIIIIIINIISCYDEKYSIGIMNLNYSRRIVGIFRHSMVNNLQLNIYLRSGTSRNCIHILRYLTCSTLVNRWSSWTSATTSYKHLVHCLANSTQHWNVLH